MEAPDPELPSRRLRAATAVLHQRVEDGMDILRRAETLLGYVALLCRLEAFYRAIEPMLPYQTEGRTQRLRDDLDALAPGWSPEADVKPPCYETPLYALGGLYVVEGAALGGQIIARFLLAQHGLTPFHGASFFASGGTSVGPRWREVRAILDATDDYAAIEAGAVATFLAFERAVIREATFA